MGLRQQGNMTNAAAAGAGAARGVAIRGWNRKTWILAAVCAFLLLSMAVLVAKAGEAAILSAIGRKNRRAAVEERPVQAVSEMILPASEIRESGDLEIESGARGEGGIMGGSCAMCVYVFPPLVSRLSLSAPIHLSSVYLSFRSSVGNSCSIGSSIAEIARPLAYCSHSVKAHRSTVRAIKQQLFSLNPKPARANKEQLMRPIS